MTTGSLYFRLKTLMIYHAKNLALPKIGGLIAYVGEGNFFYFSQLD